MYALLAPLSCRVLPVHCSVLVAGLFLWSATTALTALPCLIGSSTAAAAAVAMPGSLAGVSGLQLGLAVLLAARAVMGLASAAAMPCVTAISAQLVPASDRGSSVSFVYACFNAGQAGWGWRTGMGWPAAG